MTSRNSATVSSSRSLRIPTKPTFSTVIDRSSTARFQYRRHCPTRLSGTLSHISPTIRSMKGSDVSCWHGPADGASGPIIALERTTDRHPTEPFETIGAKVGNGATAGIVGLQLHRQLGAESGHPSNYDLTDAKVTSYSMTSSARATIEGGTVRPSAFAVLRLTTSSNVAGCWTGRSAGLAPLRIFPT